MMIRPAAKVGRYSINRPSHSVKVCRPRRWVAAAAKNTSTSQYTAAPSTAAERPTRMRSLVRELMARESSVSTSKAARMVSARSTRASTQPASSNSAALITLGR